MKLVCVFRSNSINEVNYINTMLNSADIEAVIFDEATATIAPHYLFHQGGSRVMVREEDYEDASQFVSDYEKQKREGQGQ